MKKCLSLLALFLAAAGAAIASWTTSPPSSINTGVTFNFGATGQADSGYSPTYLTIWVRDPSNVWSVAGGTGGVNNATLNASGSRQLGATGTYVWSVRLSSSPAGSTPAGNEIASGTTTGTSPITPTTFSFGNLSHTYDGNNKTATVTPSPGGATYSSDLTKGAGAGSYTVSATANGSYSGSGSATLVINKANQSTVSISPGSQTVAKGTQLTFSAGGGGVGGYNWGGSASGTGSSKAVTFNSIGSFSVTAQSPGDGNYNASNQASVTITVPNTAPTGSWHTLPGTINPGNNFTARAQGNDSDGNLVQVAVDVSVNGGSWSALAWNNGGNGSSNISDGNIITAGAAGTTYKFRRYVADTYGANTGWVESSVYTVVKMNQTISFSQPATQTYGTQLTLSASASSGLGVSYSIVSGPATVSFGVVTFTGVGNVTVRASQAGNGSYNAAPDVDRTFAVSPQSATFSLNVTSFTYTGSPQGPSVVPNPAGTTYTTGGTLSATNASGYTGTATANGNFTGSNSSLAWTIAKANQTISFSNPGTKTFGSPLNPGATASSSLAVTYTVVSGPATVSGNTVTFTGTGTVVLRASQAGDGNYNAAAAVDQTFSVVAQATTFSLSATSFTYNGSPQGPTVVPNPAGATFTTGGTLSATNVSSNTATATATGNFTGSNASLAWSIIKANQTITFSNPGPRTFGTPLNLNATASSGLAVSYAIVSGPAAVSGSTVTFTGTGTVTVRASQAGNGNYNAAPNVDQAFTVAAQSATFSLNQTSFPYTGSPQGPTVVPNPAGATFTTGGTTSATNVGSYTMTATATGNYTGSNASLGWSIVPGAQAITFANPGAQTYSIPLTLGATASSGLAVTYAVTSGPATITGNTVTFTGTGSVTITASQAGNGNWSAAANVAQTFTINPRAVTFTLSPQTFAYDGLPHTTTVVPNPAEASFTSTGTLTATALGTYPVTATATGNYTGTDNGLGWNISQGTQTITFNNPGAQAYGTPLTLGATASSGLAVTYTASGPATVSGSTVTFTGTGSVTITAAQGGNANYAPATNVAQTFTVNKANQTITFANPGDQTYGTPLSLAATSSSGLAVSYMVTSGPATISGNTVTFTYPGTVTITASQAGDANYHAATDVPQTVTVNKSPQTITFGDPGPQLYGTTTSPGATASSGMKVSYVVNSGPATVVTIFNVKYVRYTGIGSVSITASQAGNNYVAAAPTVTRTVTVNKATPTSYFVSRTLGAQTESGYLVQTADLNAAFQAGGTGAVPTGAITYVIVGPSSPVTVGTLLVAGTYTVQASYPGDSNYLATTKDAIWTITHDTDGDGILNHMEGILGTNPNVAKENDSSDQTKLNIHRPN